MNLINQVLHDLENRSALAGSDGALPPQLVRPVAPDGSAGRWMRRLIAVLVVAALAQTGWLARELRPPQALATEAAFRAEASARLRPAPPPPKAAVAAGAATPPAEDLLAPPPADEPPKPVAMEGLKLALSIETPFAEALRKARVPRKVAAPSAGPDAGKPAAEKDTNIAATEPAPTVQKRERERQPAERAEGQLARAMALLNEGRVAEAESGLQSALAFDPRNTAARQALVALLLEQHRLADAVPTLKAALQLDPDQVQFALVLARIQAETRDYAAALQTLESVKAGTNANADFNNLFAVVLQRLSRHREALERYRAALRVAPGNGASWMGLAISLESLDRRDDALQAYRSALASGTLSADARAYVDQKVRELR